ncbi:MAG: hypothetical protein NXY57DRAFT_1041227 [Lentinula lateritia]|uniref:Uncharacterized protein n=1 Tax=Lentinula lateritia TaxID=40482 RepID=A0ABQ8V237_9AGAR|nr:MAG: hypothetical protein NXY57DRAFT_1041227 [Lentinula lateritia]KAJ4468936.1 hypothetical protein C8R41DRAFT_925304 [Lentinula lateritia]
MTSYNFRHCQVKDMDPYLYRWCPCTIHGSPKQPSPPPTRSRESSLTIRSSFGPPSLAYSHSSGSSDSMKSAPPTPPPIEPYRFKAQADVRQFQERHGPNDNVDPVYGSAHHETTAKVPSVYEPQARKPGHRVFVLARDRDKLSNVPSKPLVRCTPTDQNFNNVYYAQRIGSHPAQESLPPKPNVVLSCLKTNSKFSFEPHILSKGLKTASRDGKKTWFSPNPSNDPRDPIVEQTNQRTLQRLRPNMRPSPGLSSPPSWTPKPIISSLAMVLDRLERL